MFMLRVCVPVCACVCVHACMRASLHACMHVLGVCTVTRVYVGIELS